MTSCVWAHCVYTCTVYVGAFRMWVHYMRGLSFAVCWGPQTARLSSRWRHCWSLARALSAPLLFLARSLSPPRSLSLALCLTRASSHVSRSFLPLTHMCTEKRNHKCRLRISTCLSPWDSPMYACSPSMFQRNQQRSASAKTHAFHEALPQPKEYEFVCLSKSLLKMKVFVCLQLSKSNSHVKITKTLIKNTLRKNISEPK